MVDGGATRELVAVIFSKDRPLQLEATLASFARHAKGTQNLCCKIIYYASNSFLRALYARLQSDYPTAEFIPEADFKADLLSAVAGFEHVLFLVDDALFVRDWDFSVVLKLLRSAPQTLGCSLRLGKNTTYCYSLDKLQALPQFEQCTGDFCSFSWSGAEHDFGYALEVSSSIYRCADLLPLLEELPYRNPNSLEAALADSLPRFCHHRPRLLCYSTSVCFCAPLNKVQTVAQANRAGTSQSHSAAALAEVFAAGQRIDSRAYDGFVPNACHQEVDLKLTPSDTQQPTVSIVIPCYKQSGFLDECLQSVLAQSFLDWECIIVNDGSPDDTSAVAQRIISQYPQSRIRLLEKKNGGLSDARNAGIASSRGRYILPLDCDDKLKPTALATLTAVLDKNPDTSVAFSDYETFGAENKAITCISADEFSDPNRSQNGLAYCSLFRREAWAKVGGYNTNMTWGFEDWNFWIGFIDQGLRARKVSESLFCYRVKAESMLTVAMQHDAELRAQIVLNHRRLYDAKTIAWAENIGGTASRGGIKAEPPASVPLVSVIVPTWNRPRQVETAIKSILAQTLQNFEIIVINDAGEDVRERVERLDSRVRYISHSANSGLAATRNTGVKAARGKYIAYLDDDDIYLPHHLATLVTALEKNDAKVAYSIANRAWQREVDGTWVTERRDTPYARAFDGEAIVLSNYIPVLCVMHARSCFERVEPFDPYLKRTEDWDLWIRMSRVFPFLFVPEVTCEFSWRSDGTSMTSTGRISFDWAELNIYWKCREFVRGNSASRMQHDKQIREALDRLNAAVLEGLASGKRDASKRFLGGSVLDLLARIEFLQAFYPDLLGPLYQLRALLRFEQDDLTAATAELEQCLRHDPTSLVANELLTTIKGEGGAENRGSERSEIVLSVVVPLYNAVEYTKAMLQSFFETIKNISYELIIVDNASSDGTREFLKTQGSRATIILNEKNENFSGACNRGASAARGKYLLFLNSDTVLLPGWAEPLIELAEADPSIGVIGNKHLYPDTQRLHHAGICFDRNLSNSHYLVGVDKDDPRVNHQRDLQAVNGACFFVRRDLFTKIGGFDTIYRNGCEDVEVCLKAREAGYRVVYTPKSVIYHHGQKSPGRNANNDRNLGIFLERWGTKIKPDLDQMLTDDAALLAKRAVDVSSGVAPKPRIALLTTFNQPCGIATHSAELRNALNRQLRSRTAFHPELLVLAEESSALLGPDGPDVIRCWRRSGDDFRRLREILSLSGVQVLHVQFQDGLFAQTGIVDLMNWCAEKGIRTYITFHSSERQLPLCATLINSATRSFVHLEQSRIRFVAAGADGSKIEVVTHGVRAQIEQQPSIAEARAKTSIPLEFKVVSSFGFLEPHKGVLEIIAALPKVFAIHQNLIFLFLGGGHPQNPNSAAYSNECKALAERLGIANRVIFVEGFLPEQTVSQFLSASDIILMNYTANRNEASGAAAFALSHRRPMITSGTPPFKPLADCTLQLSQDLGVAESIELILANPNFGSYLVRKSDEYRRQNSYDALVSHFIDRYEDSKDSKPAAARISRTPATPTIGIDARTLIFGGSLVRGIGHYTLSHLEEVIRQTQDWRYILYLEEIVPAPQLDRLTRYPNVSMRTLRQLKHDQVDLFHIPDPMNMSEGFDSPMRLSQGIPLSVVFYDLIPMARRAEHFDHWMPTTRTSYSARLADLKETEQAVILPISKYTASDLCNLAGFSNDRMNVIMAGLNQISTAPPKVEAVNATLQKFGISEPFFLCVGALDGHKNFKTTVEAYLTASQGAKIQLVVAGSLNDGYKSNYRESFRKQGITGIIFTDFITRDELTCLYSSAKALVFPSLYEGFGFPVLEAMANGCPVIASRVTSIPEVAGDAAILLDPLDVRGFAESMLRLTQDQNLRAQLIERGKAQAKKFTWNETARLTLAAWQKVLGLEHQQPTHAPSRDPMSPSRQMY